VVQERLIKEYLEDYHPSEELLKKVYDLNLKYNNLVEETEEIGRNINWDLKKLEWDNLFNYAENNSIDFEKLSGIVGVFGKNYSGKSSIIDTILYTIFNTTAKRERKNLSIINQNRDYGIGHAEISVGKNLYTIKRTSEKYIKKLKGKKTLEAKTDVVFKKHDTVTGKSIDCAGLTRNETDKNIRKQFGSLQDFLLTSMSSQMGALDFINEGSTRRKEILAKFLDLEFFDQKFKMAKEDASDLKAAIRLLKDRDFSEEIEEVEKQIKSSEFAIRKQSEKCEDLEEIHDELEEKIRDIELSIKSAPTEIIDIVSISKALRIKKIEMESVHSENARLAKEKDMNNEILTKMCVFLNDFDIESLREKKNNIDLVKKKIKAAKYNINSLLEDIDRRRKKVLLLSQVPCADRFLNCRFIKDAHKAKLDIPLIEKNCNQAREDKEELSISLQDLNPVRTEEHIEKYEQILCRKEVITADLSRNKLKMERNSVILKSLRQSIDLLNKKREKYKENKEAIENLEALYNKKAKLSSEHTEVLADVKKCKQQILNLYKTQGTCEEKLKNLTEQKERNEEIREEYSAYDLFMRCMHSCGISYDIIKKRLPIINEEIAKVLVNVVEFEIFFHGNEKQLNIRIKHPKHDARSLSMGSGAEKTIAAMAIRLALTSVSNLPKPNIFILDEPGTALDEENMEGFIRILDLIKSHFKTVLLISHLESLKDCVDTQITIEKINSFASVNHRN